MAEWPSDKELEEIYRKGSENHYFPYTQSAWEGMEILLTRRRRKIILLYLTAMVGVIFALILMFNNINIFSSKVSDDAYTTHDVTQHSTSLSLDQSQIGNDIQVTLDHAEENISHSQSSLTSDLTQQKINPNITNQSSSILYSKKDLHSNLLNETMSNHISIGQGNETLDKGSDIDIFDQTSESVLAVHNKGQIPTNHPLDFVLERLLSVPIQFVSDIESTNIKIPQLSAINDSKKPLRYPFIISSLIGTESSWTPSGSYSQLDINVGLKGSYFVSDKIGITLEAIYINDIFTAPGEDYNPKGDFWKAAGVSGFPSIAEAKSSMIEISPGITYAFGGIHKNGLSLSANLTSNFMLNENYDYFYADETENFNSTWTMSNNTLLSALNLSAHYRIRMSDTWIIEGGPYVKLPLDGIGHGDIMLSTLGVRFSVGLVK